VAKVFLSAGHGGSDPGAVGNGLKEKDINLQTLLACKEVLEAHGVQVVASRTQDENDPVGQEVKEANASKADVAVSFHVNAGGGDGFEAFYHTSSAKGKKLAQLGEKYVKALGQNSRGIKSGNHLYFVKNTTMTAVLFESFFIDSKDKAIGDTKAEQKAFGVAYAKAILEFLGIPYGETKENTTKTNTKTPTTNNAKAPTTNTIYRVQVGAYGVKANAEAMQKKLKAAGFDAYITTK
jgi:N-acetylmuramoyl-L-alanine amidase